jgi:hypothetical protein
MKIYLAARYSRFPEMQRYRTDLEKLGHIVTSRWINGEHQDDDDKLTGAALYAKHDIADLISADTIIAFTERPYDPIGSRGGRHVEFGMAYAWNKRLIVIGYRENVFYHLPEVEFFETWLNCLNSLDLEALGKCA